LSSNVNECKPLSGGGRRRAAAASALGKAVQVEPIKPTLKAPGTKRLKPQYDGLLSNFAFKFNLRRYPSGCFGGIFFRSAAAKSRPLRTSSGNVGGDLHCLLIVYLYTLAASSASSVT